MVRLLSAFVLAGLLSVGCRSTSTASPGTQAPATLDRTVRVQGNYLLHLPADYGKEPGRKWPLMIFLHGSGERGSDIKQVAKNGPPKIAAASPDFPFILASPQCPKGRFFEPVQVIALLDELQEKYAVDPDRCYLTGLSMGGAGTWDTACQYPGRFAAIAPLCGKGKPWRAEYLKQTPVYAVWGEKDSGMAEGLLMIRACEKARVPITFVSHADLGHDVWTRTYADQAIYDWLLSHRRGASATQPATLPVK
jgi:predicted peptidase